MYIPLSDEFQFVILLFWLGNLQNKASWACNIGWGEARKPKPRDHFHTRGRLANNWYESGLTLFVYRRKKKNPAYAKIMIAKHLCNRITIWKKLSKWGICCKNFLRNTVVPDIQRSLDSESIFLLAGMICCINFCVFHCHFLYKLKSMNRRCC